MPFETDITELVRLGAEKNLLVLRVTGSNNTADRTQKGNEHAGHDLGGIVRSVRVFALPTVNLASFHVRTELDLVAHQARLLVNPKIANEGPTFLHSTGESK